jgi:hypothetical protein
MAIPRKKKICKVCGDSRYIFSRGLCEKCSKLKKLRTTKLSKAKARRRKNRESIPSLKRRARYWFQRWIRYRDLGHKCICESCPNILSNIKAFDAGHYHKAELYSNLVFDEDNVHGQCKGCNGFRDGNIIEYRKGLVKKIGIDGVISLEDRALYNKEIFKWNRDELILLLEEYKTLVKLIEG